MAEQGTRRRVAMRLGGGVLAILLIFGFVSFVRMILASKVSKPERQIQTVQIIRPPPPPPPDQPPPPPPEKTEQPLPKDQPEPTPDQPQQAPEQPLGIDAEGSAGGDSFGLAARSGGSDLVGGTGTAPFARYTMRITDAIRERLSSLPCARNAKGSLSFHLVFEASGKIREVQLASTTGNEKVDACIDTGLTSMPPIGDPLPPGMPAEVNIRVVSRL